ncbi:hypothetical protein HHX47_DHR5000634 [Lentinula edodes]|nr:hypothetical protein HHX47_DHR5000634 [Lentinula edodes]
MLMSGYFSLNSSQAPTTPAVELTSVPSISKRLKGGTNNGMRVYVRTLRRQKYESSRCIYMKGNRGHSDRILKFEKLQRESQKPNFGKTDAGKKYRPDLFLYFVLILMPPRKRTVFTQESIDQQLQQIHLLDQSSSSENLEQLGPIIKQIHTGRQQDAFLRSVQALVDSKDAEIERICGENYQDFISSVSTLFTVKSYTDKMKENISSLDASVSQLGRGLVEKKRALLQTKKTAANLDEAIDNLQACLRVLDVVHRVGEMISEGKYWSALRSLEDIQNLPQTSLSQTPFYRHLLSSLPSLRVQIKDAVTASMKEWLLKIRENSGEIGRLALEAMEMRTRRWRSRRDKDPLLRMSRVGSAVELVTYEKTEFNVLDNDKLTTNFNGPTKLIERYAVSNRRTISTEAGQIQSDLILPMPLPLGSLPAVTQEISGYFIVETHVLETTGTFRSGREVEELWEGVVSRLTVAVQSALRPETDPDSFLRVKECLIGFITTLEIVWQDDCQPMYIQSQQELKTVLDVVWISDEERAEVAKTAQRGGTIRLKASSSFDETFTRSVTRIKSVINSKLDDFFELSEYNWVPTSREEGPNMYLYELVNWLTTVVDSQLLIASSYIDEAYMGAAEYIAECFMDFLAGRNIAMMNENAISNLLVDCDFLENEFGRIGRPHLSSAFNELRVTTGIVLADKVQEYLIPANRQNTYAVVKHKRLQALLEKLAQYGSTRRDTPGRQLGEKRRKEADAVGRLFPGQGR